MEHLPFIFIGFKTFYFLRTKDICYCLATVKRLAKERREHPEQKHIVIVTQVSIIYILYMIADVLFFFYTCFLIFLSPHKIPGLLLLTFTALEAYAMRYKVAGTYDEDKKHNFVYPTFWLRNLLFFSNCYILLRLHIALTNMVK